MTITLYELRGQADLRYSVFSWRTRMALRHKGLDFGIEVLPLGDKSGYGFSGGTTVPILVDDATVVRDSWAIAEHLERAYPDRPSLFGGETGHALTAFVNGWADRSLIPALAPILAPDIHARVDAADQAYFRANFEKFFRSTLEEMRGRRETALPGFRRALEPARAALRTQLFIAGPSARYADFIVFSILQWARLTSPQPVLEADDRLLPWFDRMLDLFGGYARSYPGALDGAILGRARGER